MCNKSEAQLKIKHRAEFLPNTDVQQPEFKHAGSGHTECLQCACQ